MATRESIITAARAIAQDTGADAARLLDQERDYSLAVDQAIEHFRMDRPNLRVTHYTVLAESFRFVLLGTGVILPTSGADRWIDGASALREVYHPYDTSSRENTPLDRNSYRVRREPGPKVVLELLSITPSSGVLRLEYTAPHTVHQSDGAQTSILDGDLNAFHVLTAAKICEMTARRYVQNTGSSVFQNDSVDRRTQSDIMASRAKELMKTYGMLVGSGASDDGSGASVSAAAAVKKMAIATQHNRGRLWHVEE